eukprot:15476576-Alexandrium_andersonii.AAC.1
MVARGGGTARKESEQILQLAITVDAEVCSKPPRVLTAGVRPMRDRMCGVIHCSAAVPHQGACAIHLRKLRPESTARQHVASKLVAPRSMHQAQRVCTTARCPPRHPCAKANKRAAVRSRC